MLGNILKSTQRFTGQGHVLRSQCLRQGTPFAVSLLHDMHHNAIVFGKELQDHEEDDHDEEPEEEAEEPSGKALSWPSRMCHHLATPSFVASRWI